MVLSISLGGNNTYADLLHGAFPVDAAVTAQLGLPGYSLIQVT